MSNSLEIKILGSPQVFQNGQPVKFATRKALVLFIYLVVERGTHPREKLQALFWPESETRQAQSALRSTLARIKDGLRGVNEPLLIEGDCVGFNTSCVSSLDLDLVAQATADTQPLQIAPPKLIMLQNAVEVVRGPFMDGLSLPDAPAFDEWLTIQRAAWGHRQTLIFDRLSLHQLENHLIQPAIETVIRWIILDHLNEIAYQRLMRLHFLNGDRSSALQTYETCRDILKQELGVTPSAETEEALTYIRSGQASARVAESDVEAREAFHIPFVGRSHEYQGLVQTVRLVKKGRPQVVVISGESGIGKTRLADEFLKWAGTEGADVLHGRAFEMSAQLLPYQPIIDALRERLDRENAPEDLLDDAWLAELTRILPELRERYPDLPFPIGDDTTARARLFEAIARLAEALSTRHPLIWLMDDLQWADTETLELLRYLSRNWRKGKSPILLLILMRSEALGYGTKQRDWMSGLTRDVNVTRFALTPVLASDIQELIQSLAGDNTSGISDLSAWFTAETAGQPFFLTETLTALNEYGALVWDDGKLDPLATLGNLKVLDVESLTTVIRDVVLSRLEWLSQSASSMLSAAAVIGRNCSFERLQQISGLPEQDSLNSLDELLSARMIVEIRDEARPYIISHDRIREVVYAQLSKARKQIFHRRAALALTEQKAPPVELANHYAEAGDKEKAVEYLLKAGDDARGLYAYEESIAAYQRALSFLREMGDYEQTRILAWKASAQFALGKMCRFRGEFVTALEWLADAKEARAKLEDTAGLAQVLIETGIALHHKGEYAQVRDVLNAGLALAREVGDTRSVALALLMLGKGVAVIQVDYVAARALYEESLSLYREMGDQAGISDLLNELGTIALYQGDYVAAQGLHEECLSLKCEMGDKAGIPALFLNLGMGAKAGISSSLANLGLVAWAQGKTAAARELLEESLSLKREIGDKAGIPASLTNLALVALVQGNTTEARELLEESLTWIERIDENLFMAYFLLALGLVDLAENNPEARGHIFHSLRLSVKMGAKVTQTSSLVGVAGLALQAGDARGTAQWLGAVESALKGIGAVMEPDVILIHAQMLVAVREQLGESAFQSAWEEGSQWSLEDAVKKALEEN